MSEFTLRMRKSVPAWTFSGYGFIHQCRCAVHQLTPQNLYPKTKTWCNVRCSQFKVTLQPLSRTSRSRSHPAAKSSSPRFPHPPATTSDLNGQPRSISFNLLPPIYLFSQSHTSFPSQLTRAQLSCLQNSTYLRSRSPSARRYSHRQISSVTPFSPSSAPSLRNMPQVLRCPRSAPRDVVWCRRIRGICCARPCRHPGDVNATGEKKYIEDGRIAPRDDASLQDRRSIGAQ